MQNDYSNQLINGVPSIWLQNIGWVPAKPAQEFKIGESMTWNFGGTSKVISVIKESEKQIVFLIEWVGYNKKVEQGERKFLKSRLVAMG